MSQPSFSWSRPQDTAGADKNLFRGASSNAGNGISHNQVATLASTQSASVLDQLQRIRSSWDPASPNCTLQYYFYNKVPADQASLYMKAPAQDQAKWDAAMQARPDASSVPVLACGFSDLQKRVALQESQVASYRARMHELNNKLDEVTTRHELHTLIKCNEMRVRHVKLVQRSLNLAAKVQILRSRGYVLRPNEELLKRRLEDLNAQIDDPAVFGRINEIWARLTALREKVRLRESQHARTTDEGSITHSRLDWERDADPLEKLARVLKAQQMGIGYLAQIVQTDSAVVSRQGA